MNVNKDTVFINHDVESREECLGLVITNYENAPYVNIIASKYGCTYGGPGVLKGALKVRAYIWTRGEDVKNEIHIISGIFLTDVMLNNIRDLL